MKTRVYGNQPTRLTLTALAQEIYNETDPITIEEIEDNGEVTYNMYGVIENDGLTAEDVNGALESLATFTVKDEFWDDWGITGADEATIDLDTMRTLAYWWHKSVDELMEQCTR